jgi:hypothetical protein
MEAPICALHMVEEDDVLGWNVRMALWERRICVGRMVAEIVEVIHTARRVR